MIKIDVATKNNSYEIYAQTGFISTKKVKTDRKLFSDMCKKGCKNYNNKYSCPPFSPDFRKISEKYAYLFVIMLHADLSQLSSKGYTEYHKSQVANPTMKSRAEKTARELEKIFGGYMLGSGSCRLCRPCRVRKKQPCRYPQKARPSMEATGIDCDFLANTLFNKPLQWYKDKKAPKYSSVLSAVLVGKKDKNMPGETEKLMRRL